jgi:hypothetical protein
MLKGEWMKNIKYLKRFFLFRGVSYYFLVMTIRRPWKKYRRY